MNANEGRLVGGVGLVLVMAAGCAGPRMVAPADVASGSRAYEAMERSAATGMLVDESFKLGPYSVDEVDRDATSKSGFSVGGYGKSSTTTGYTYEFNAGKRKLGGACGSQSKKQGFSLGGGSTVDWGNTEVTCECKAGGAVSSVHVKGTGKKAEGSLTIGEATYQVMPVQETDKAQLDSGAAGFRVDQGDAVKGAVEVLRPGKIWLGESVADEEAGHLSCLFAGLMLYVPPSDH